MLLDELKNRSVLILGFGKEGRDSFLFLRKLFPQKTIGIADIKTELRIKNYDLKRDKKVKLHLGEDYLRALEKYDLIIKSPGIPIHLPEIEKAFKKGKITSQAEIFFENCPGKIIGVTGTKGKGTTASLIYQILREGKLKAHLIGNIENPVLRFLPSATPNDIYVYELSSHQLYNLKKSPSIAVFLNLYPAHLDFFKNFQEYILAKSNIIRYQKESDYLIYNSKNNLIKKIVKNSIAKKIPILANKKYLKYLKEIKNKIPSIGLENLMAAIEVGKIFGLKERNIIRTIKKFKGLPHRLEFVGIYKGIKFYNDSLATIPESTIFALDVLGRDVQTIILGGSENNVKPKNLAKRILKSNIKNIIFFPTTGEKIWQDILREYSNSPRSISRVESPRLITNLGRLQAFFVDNMKEAVRISFENTKKGKICLLSPAYPSFSLFKNYKERGNLFKKYLKKYGKGQKLS